MLEGTTKSAYSLSERLTTSRGSARPATAPALPSPRVPSPRVVWVKKLSHIARRELEHVSHQTVFTAYSLKMLTVGNRGPHDVVRWASGKYLPSQLFGPAGALKHIVQLQTPV